MYNSYMVICISLLFICMCISTNIQLSLNLFSFISDILRFFILNMQNFSDRCIHVFKTWSYQMWSLFLNKTIPRYNLPTDYIDTLCCHCPRCSFICMVWSTIYYAHGWKWHIGSSVPTGTIVAIERNYIEVYLKGYLGIFNHISAFLDWKRLENSKLRLILQSDKFWMFDKSLYDIGLIWNRYASKIVSKCA